MRTGEFPLIVKLLASTSCLAWISAISLSLIHLLHLPSSAGWIIAGMLCLAAGLPIIWFRLEMGHALDISDYSETAFQMDATTEEDFHIPAEPPGDICVF